MKCDYNVHTSFANPLDTSMVAMVWQAMNLGLDEICFADDPARVARTEPWFEEIERLRRRYGRRVAIRAGAELAPENAGAADGRFDYIVLNCRQVGDRLPDESPLEAQHRHYSAIDALTAAHPDYTVLGHLGSVRGVMPDAASLDIAERILKRVISEGKGLEVNTTAFPDGAAMLTPPRRVLELYRDLGGTILTLGSGARRFGELANRTELVKPMLRRIGFRVFCTYENRQPVFHRL